MPHDVIPLVRPLVEGPYKGGRNAVPSQIVARPRAPAPIAREADNGRYLWLRCPPALPSDVEG